MTKRCIFILFCATALFAPTADAYTAIAVASSSSNGGGEQCAYQFFNPKTPGQHGLFLSRDLSRSEIEQGLSNAVAVTVESIQKLWSRQGNPDISR
jgi:hypothetical protein